MKARELKEMLLNPDTIDAVDIANYAIYTTGKPDGTLSREIVELICSYTESVVAQRLK